LQRLPSTRDRNDNDAGTRYWIQDEKIQSCQLSTANWGLLYHGILKDHMVEVTSAKILINNHYTFKGYNLSNVDY